MNSKNLRSLQNARKRFSGFSRLLAECSTEVLAKVLNVFLGFYNKMGCAHNFA